MNVNTGNKLIWFVSETSKKMDGIYLKNIKNLNITPYITMTLLSDRSEIFDANGIAITNMMIIPTEDGIRLPIPSKTKNRKIIFGDKIIIKVNDYSFALPAEVWWNYTQLLL